MWSKSVRLLNPNEALATREEKPKPKTNADLIRAMSDEELAEDYCKFLNAMLSKVVSKYKLDFEYDMEKGKSIMLKHLQQPAEGE